MGRVKLKYIKCKVCGKIKSRKHFCLRKSGKRKGQLRDRVCNKCSIRRFGPSKMVYRKHKDIVCCVCGFMGESCQLDVDHIDGNHKNNSIDNLQTLCANCHRLKTHLHREEVRKTGVSRE
ncbi:MAG: HNH endonuclease signature motif containing protein [Candidatus Shapirobacteria bacterium]|nr:HNH endonuclease signature motif containing protein [Candidatus Shapirobacteria bacterium]